MARIFMRMPGMVSPSPAPRERSVVKGKSNAGRASLPADIKRAPARQKKTVADSALRILQGAASDSTITRAATLGFNGVLCRLGDGTAAFDAIALRALGKQAATN